MTARREYLLLIMGFVALLAVAAISAWLVRRNADFNQQVARTLERKGEIVRMLSLAQDAETGQRGYILTGAERYLAPYDEAMAQSEPRLRRLRDLIGDGGGQLAALDTLQTALRFKLTELRETVEMQRAGRHDDALALVLTDRGRNAMLAIRETVDAMAAAEDAVFDERSDQVAWSSNLLLLVMVLGLLIAAGLSFLAQMLVRRQARRLERAQADLADAYGELEKVNAGLESAVAERTADLTTANEEIQRFAYIVSHDLRAPLVNVMGFTSELDAARKTLKAELDALAERAPGSLSGEARTIVDEDLPEAIGFIRTSTAKMDRLINAILRLSREGRRVVTPESVSVEEMSKAIASTLHQQMQAANAEIVVEPGVPPLVTDRLVIEQIFQNLIENAVKYLDRSRPGRIVVRGRRVGPQVEYAIEDNGRGIDAKDHERVFELFRRAGAQDQPGEGLGLAFVRASVRRLGGVIRLTSEPGRGSTFHLDFPAVLRPQTEKKAA